jgi:hypothetical protein
MLCEAGIRRLPIIALSVCGVSMIGYKAKQAGVEIVLVEPRYISQTCSRCLHIGIHLDQSKFHCRNCGLQLNADLIGAKSIALGHEAASSANIRRSKSTGPKRSVLRRERASETVVSLRQNGVGPEKKLCRRHSAEGTPLFIGEFFGREARYEHDEFCDRVDYVEKHLAPP